LQYLAAAGAQVVILTPRPLSPSVIQLLLLLRSATENERLYAEECDLADVASIRKFVGGWQKDARSGMVQDLEARIDAVILCDEEDMAPTPGIGVRPAFIGGGGASEEVRVSAYGMTRLTGRHALVQLLLPILLRSAATSASPLRIINTVSPFYATATAATFRPKDLEFRSDSDDHAPRKYPASQPWMAQGQIALASILLWKEFQKRVKSTATTARGANAQPASSTSSAAASSTDDHLSNVADATPILALSVCSGLLRSTIRSFFRASPSSPNFSVLGCAAYLLVFPLVWIFAKSAEEGAQVVLAALMADVYKEGQGQGRRKTEKAARGPDGKTLADEGGKRAPLDEDRPPLLVRPGALYREGLEVK
jgi:hypothetical protein